MKRLELPELKVERSEGRSFNASPSETSPVPVRSSTVTEVSGTADCRVGRAIREPVTRIGCDGPSSSASSSLSAAASSLCESCANDGMAANSARLIAEPAIIRRDFFIYIAPQLVCSFRINAPVKRTDFRCARGKGAYFAFLEFCCRIATMSQERQHRRYAIMKPNIAVQCNIVAL
jgi:hypothetical protein